MTGLPHNDARELIDEALEQTWGGGELPVGPGISGTFQKNVRLAKDLARELLASLAREQTEREARQRAEAALRQIERLTVKR